MVKFKLNFVYKFEKTTSAYEAGQTIRPPRQLLCRIERYVKSQYCRVKNYLQPTLTYDKKMTY